MKIQKHTIAMLVEDQPGVLTRIAGMFARRGFNIDTITVGKTTKKGVSKMVVSAIGDDRTLEQVEKQINKLIDVIKVYELPADSSVIVELCLLKVGSKDKKEKDDILKYADIYKARVVDITDKRITMQLVGEPDKIESFIELVTKYGIKEISRTGVTAITRG